ncbi:MAG: LuxR C-terminal-related transcriptional regulator [Saprospiraceae bacterium]
MSNSILEDLKNENQSIVPYFKGEKISFDLANKLLCTDIFIIDESITKETYELELQRLKKQKPSLIILKIFNFLTDNDIIVWMQMGIDGIVPLGIDIIDLNASIFTLLTKRKFIHPDLSILVFNCFEKNTVVSFEMKNKSKLILQYLSEGKSYKEIAGILNVSIDVVRYNIKEIYKKLGVKNKGGAVGKYNNSVLA